MKQWKSWNPNKLITGMEHLRPCPCHQPHPCTSCSRPATNSSKWHQPRCHHMPHVSLSQSQNGKSGLRAQHAAVRLWHPFVAVVFYGLAWLFGIVWARAVAAPLRCWVTPAEQSKQGITGPPHNTAVSHRWDQWRTWFQGGTGKCRNGPCPLQLPQPVSFGEYAQMGLPVPALCSWWGWDEFLISYTWPNLSDTCRHCHCLQVGRVFHRGFVTSGKRRVGKSQPCRNSSSTALLHFTPPSQPDHSPEADMLSSPPLSVPHELLTSPGTTSSHPCREQPGDIAGAMLAGIGMDWGGFSLPFPKPARAVKQALPNTREHSSVPQPLLKLDTG